HPWPAVRTPAVHGTGRGVLLLRVEDQERARARSRSWPWRGVAMPLDPVTMRPVAISASTLSPVHHRAKGPGPPWRQGSAHLPGATTRKLHAIGRRTKKKRPAEAGRSFSDGFRLLLAGHGGVAFTDGLDHGARGFHEHLEDLAHRGQLGVELVDVVGVGAGAINLLGLGDDRLAHVV